MILVQAQAQWVVVVFLVPLGLIHNFVIVCLLGIKSDYPSPVGLFLLLVVIVDLLTARLVTISLVPVMEEQYLPKHLEVLFSLTVFFLAMRERLVVE